MTSKKKNVRVTEEDRSRTGDCPKGGSRFQGGKQDVQSSSSEGKKKRDEERILVDY